jgi:hypothetical protein
MKVNTRQRARFVAIRTIGGLKQRLLIPALERQLEWFATCVEKAGTLRLVFFNNHN